MSSYYQISNDILDIFNQIEENDGEVTDEQLEQLSIKEDELKNKLDSYRKAINVWKSETDACKAEEKRIAAIRKIKENRIDRLKTNMLQAVQLFGNTGKSGNKIIELNDCRLSTRKSSSVEFNSERVAILINTFISYIKELVKNDILETGADVDFQGIVDAINAICVAEKGEDFERYTLDDLCAIPLNISIIATIPQLFIRENDILNAIGNSIQLQICSEDNKTFTKSVIEHANECNKEVTVAKLVSNESLQIK